MAGGFNNGNVNVVIDLGNRAIKIVRMDGLRVVASAIMDHALAEIDEHEYDRLVHYYGQSTTAFSFIKWRGRFFVSGELAYSSRPNLVPLTGRTKYERDYYGIMLMSALLHLFKGNLPERINVFAGHPPGDLRFVKELMKSIAGSWRFENLSYVHRTIVEHVGVYDEVVGGVMNALMNPEGHQYAADHIRGQTLVADLGGGTFDIAVLKSDNSVDYQRIGSYHIGGNEIVKRFKEMFDARHHEIVRQSENGLPIYLVHQIMLDPNHRFYTMGTEIDCSDIFTDAVRPTMAEMKRRVQEFTRGAFVFNQVYVSGGVGGLVYPEICEYVFPEFANNNAIRGTDARDKMILAAATGAGKILNGIINMQAKGKKRGA